MNAQDALTRATQALADGNREAAKFYIMVAQSDPAELAELKRGAARMKQIAGVVFWFAVLFFIAVLVKVFGL